jgi:hypothetical protein
VGNPLFDTGVAQPPAGDRPVLLVASRARSCHAHADSDPPSRTKPSQPSGMGSLGSGIMKVQTGILTCYRIVRLNRLPASSRASQIIAAPPLCAAWAGDGRRADRRRDRQRSGATERVYDSGRCRFRLGWRGRPAGGELRAVQHRGPAPGQTELQKRLNSRSRRGGSARPHTAPAAAGRAPGVSRQRQRPQPGRRPDLAGRLRLIAGRDSADAA